MVYINYTDFVSVKNKNSMILNIEVKKEKYIMKIKIKLKNIVVIIKTKGMSIMKTEEKKV